MCISTGWFSHTTSCTSQFWIQSFDTCFCTVPRHYLVCLCFQVAGKMFQHQFMNFLSSFLPWCHCAELAAIAICSVHPRLAAAGVAKSAISLLSIPLRFSVPDSQLIPCEIHPIRHFFSSYLKQAFCYLTSTSTTRCNIPIRKQPESVQITALLLS